MTERTAARRAELPEGEATLLRGLPAAARNARLRDLYEAGWSLSSLAAAFTPARPRTTIRAWVTSAGASDDTLPPVPRPAAPKAVTAAQRDVRRFAAPRRRRMGLPPDASTEIATLAPLARRHRPRTSPNNPARLANEGLTRLTRSLYARGASIPELAEAAGVTYRAMRRRVRGA